MLLAIDVGNTNITNGVFDGKELRKTFRMTTKQDRTSDEYGVFLAEWLILNGFRKEDISDVIISSVVPDIMHSLTSGIIKFFDITPLIVGPGIKTGLNMRIDEPSSAAADLVVGSVGAVACYGAPVIVVSMRTATTLVATDKNGAFRGGVILPGVKLGYGALAAGTSLLPDVAILPPKKVVGANTVDAMRSGAIFGTASMLDGMLERMEAELGYSCTVVATGGLAKDVIPCCKRTDIRVDPDLLLKGLWTLYQKNK